MGRRGFKQKGQASKQFSPGFNRPHVVRPVAHAQPMRYQVDGGKIFGGLTTVIIELNDVEPAKGGTVSCHDIAGIWVAFFSRCQRYRCGQEQREHAARHGGRRHAHRL